MTAVGNALQAARQLGPAPLFHYSLYQVGLRSGWIRRRTPAVEWRELPGPASRRDPEPIWATEPPAEGAWRSIAEAEARQRADDILSGRFRLFGLEPVELGFPPDWGAFAPLAGAEAAGSVPLDRHWTEYDLAAMGADVKLLWEPSRFGWAWDLARAYLWRRDPKYADAFWTLFGSWRLANQPNVGPHWISAQEAAFRLLALAYAHRAFADWLDADQLKQLEQVLGGHAARIPPTLAYSRAQANNHLLTEAAALETAGWLLAWHPNAPAWRRQGRRWFEAALAGQVFDDGGYVQHSTNYQRLALDLGLWQAHLASRMGAPLSLAAQEALRRMARLLGRLADPASGQLPNFGPNDGAQLMPLTSCAFDDVRPSLQAAAVVLGGLPRLPDGPWNEAAHWLTGEVPTAAPIDEFGTQRSFPDAGLYLMEGGQGRGVLRAVRFRNRPGHADQLHLDLWHDGRNLALDGGTYLYGGEPPWNNGLAGAAAHNGLIVDGREPMRQVGRFLWLEWGHAKLLFRRQSAGGRLEALAAEHDGYRSLGVRHRRTVVRVEGWLWLVVDDLLGAGEHLATLAWRLPIGEATLTDGVVSWADHEARARLRIEAPPAQHALFVAGEQVAGDPMVWQTPVWGWHAPRYAQRQPATHSISQVKAQLPVQIRSWWSFGERTWQEVLVDWRAGSAGLPQLALVAVADSMLEL